MLHEGAAMIVRASKCLILHVIVTFTQLKRGAVGSSRLLSFRGGTST